MKVYELFGRNYSILWVELPRLIAECGLSIADWMPPFSDFGVRIEFYPILWEFGMLCTGLCLSLDGRTNQIMDISRV